VLIEAVKPCEDAARAYILRVYESTGAYTNASLSFGHPVKSLALTNMLEEEQEALPAGDTASLTFRPFEIKTLRVGY
jgi:alpha-mannosidase